MGIETHKVSKRELEREVNRLVHELADLKRSAKGDDLGLMALEDAEGHLERSSGYFRLGQDRRTGLYWARWKWTDGAFNERYQFGSGETLALALMCLGDKITAVEAGKLKAPLDTPPKPKRNIPR